MNMKKTEKSFFVQNLTEELNSANTLVLVDYSGLSVKMQQDLKKRLAEISSKLLVVKNSLFKLAGEKAGLPQETLTDTVLSGPTALVVTEEDPIAPLQVLAKFAKEFGILNLKAGVIEKDFQDKDSLTTLSKLSSKNVLLEQVVSAIGSPLFGLVGTLQGNTQKLISILDQAAKKESS